MRSWRALYRLAVLLAALLGGALSPPATARAASFTVDTLADTIGAGCPAGACSLRRAIGAAASGDTINFSVTGTLTLNPANGSLFVDKNLTISGPGASSLAISGNNAIAVFTIGTFTPSTVAISGLTIQGGSTNIGSGGGLNVVGGTVTLTNATVSGNHAGAGGGINNSGTLSLNTVTVSGNSASGSGGGILNRSGGTLTLTNTVVSGNTASGTGASGGGIANDGTLMLTGSVVSGNTVSGASSSGAGIAATGNTTVLSTAILNNTGAVQGGGVFFAANGASTLTLQNSTLAGNTSTGDGGAIFAALGTVNLNSVTIANNTAAPSFGAVFSSSAFGGAVVNFRNSILAGNSGPNASPPNVLAPRFGDQGFNLSSDGSPAFTDPTSVNNTNPLLGPPAPCGSGQALFPQPGSPAIGSGNSGLTSDQCGNTRVLPDTKGAVFVTGSAATSTSTATRTSTATSTPTTTNTPITPVTAPTSTATSTAITPPTTTNTPITPVTAPTSTATAITPPTATPTPPPGSADLAIEKTASPPRVEADGNLTVEYTVTVRNLGPATATNVSVSDFNNFFMNNTQTQGIRDVTVNGLASSLLPRPIDCFAGFHIECDGFTLLPGQILVVTYTVAFAQGVLPIRNTADVAANEPDPNQNNNSVSITSDLPSLPGVTPPQLPPGERFGQPCRNGTCEVASADGTLTGTGQHVASMNWTLSVRAGRVPAGTRAIVVLLTTAGREFFACNAAVAGTPTGCTGRTAGDGLVGGTVQVVAGGVVVATGTITSAGAAGVVAVVPLLPPPLPPLPPLLPPPPPAPPFVGLPPVSAPPAAAEVPIIPEAPPGALLLAALAVLGALTLHRRR